MDGGKIAEAMSTKIQSVPENVAAGLQTLRNEQRAFATKLSELQMDLNEHKLVIETLEKVERDRKCFRLLGGERHRPTLGMYSKTSQHA